MVQIVIVSIKLKRLIKVEHLNVLKGLMMDRIFTVRENLLSQLKPYLFIKIHDIYKIIIKNGVAEDSIVKGVRDTFRLKNGETLLKYKSRLYDYYSPIKGSKKRQRIYYNLTAGKW
jgi:hypothetical protein